MLSAGLIYEYVCVSARTKNENMYINTGRTSKDKYLTFENVRREALKMLIIVLTINTSKNQQRSLSVTAS